MKKTRHLNALQSFFWATVGSLVVLSPACAALPLEDDFDGYSLGDLGGQGGWQCQNGASYGQIVDTDYESSPYSLLGAPDSCYNDTGASTSDGEVFIWINKDSEMPASWGLFDLIGEGETYPTNAILSWLSNSSQLSDWYYVDSDWGQLSAGWNKIGIQWHYEATPANRWVKVSLNDGEYVEGSANFKAAIAAGSILAAPVVGYAFFGSNTYIDTIGSGVPPVVEGYAPILTPTSPERNTETVVDFDDGFEVSGSVVIPTANTHIYDKLIVNFRKPDSFFPAKTLTINLGGLTAGQSYNYSATTTVPITSSGNNFFKVGYTLTGSTYAGSYANNPPISEEALAFDNTWVKDSAEDAPAYLITPSIKPEQDALEDCGEYTGIDAVICNFRNFIVGAFLPTDDALAQIGGTMDALKNKFPMNYARAIGDSFSTITAGIDDDAGFSLTILGTSSSADTSFFSQDIGGGATLGGTTKLMLTFLVFMVFMFWGLGYMHRVLK
jgi:hypothetical protein